jgi:uncharacterized protein (DUF58 family)
VTVSTVMRWRAGPAHLRAVLVGVLGVGAAVVFRAPTLLVLAAPFAFVAVWASAARPTAAPSLTGRLAPRAVREGQATTWTGTFAEVDGVDHVVALAPRRRWLQTDPSYGAVVADAASGAAPPRASLPMRALRWGRHDLGPVNVVAVSPWGAFRWMSLDSDHRVTALPVPTVFDSGAVPQRGSGLIGINRSTRPGDGAEFAGIRAFRPGDRLRRVNWRRSLRDGELRVNATYADQDTHVALFVDAGGDYGPSDGIDGAASSLDTAVRAAGALAEHFVLRGDRVSLRVTGARRPTVLQAATGSRHLRRVLEVLAAIERDSLSRQRPRMPEEILTGDAVAILLSPLVTPEALQRAISLASHGLGVAVIDTLPDVVDVDDDPATRLAWRIRLLERRREVRAVRDAGVPVVRWRGAGSLDEFLRELSRRATVPRVVRR